MRRLLCVFALIAMMSDAFAGDYDVPVLRGSESVVPGVPFGQAPPLYPRWAGLYFGGQAGMAIASINFADATQTLVAHELRELALEDDDHPSHLAGARERAIRAPSVTAASSATIILGRE